jgi:hypothetical protein
MKEWLQDFAYYGRKGDRSEIGVNVAAVHFLRIFQWWGKTAKRPIFVALPPG